jgi:TRAP-type C4-dicarboxylate transport system substrate-binding protein
MKMLRRTVLATLSAATLVASMGAIAQDIKPRLIRFGYGLNEQSNQGRAVKVFADEVEKLSGGKMKIRAVGAAALGPDTQMQQALIGGAQEMMVGSTATLVGITKEMALWDTPFLFNSAKEADAVLDGPIGQKVMDKLQEKGLVGLVYWENGFRNMTNSQRPVAKMEDLAASSCGSCRTRCTWKPSRPGRQRHSAAVLRAVQRAGDQDRGRPGEPVQHHPVQQVL